MPQSQFLIERIILSNHRQFSHCDIELCDPVSGEPLRECCFIGANGTGKSQLLKSLHQAVAGSGHFHDEGTEALVLTKIRCDGNSFYQLRNDSAERFWYSDSIETEKAWKVLAKAPLSADEFADAFQDHRYSSGVADEMLKLRPAEIVTAFFSPLESLVNGEQADEFAGFLEALIRERESEFFAFMKQGSNKSKTVDEAGIDFLESRPSVLNALKEIWDRVLGQAALVFDAESQGKLISIRTGEEINFSNLSQGIQHFLLRIGQTFCHYFQKENQSGFIFLDEPETSLHPEMQFNYINSYRSIIGDHPTQLFVSTHSPLIATQFPDHSRIILNFDHDGAVQVSRGIAPEGSDPNQILTDDFGLKSLRPQKRKEQVGNYSKLKRAIRESDDQEDELADLIEQVMAIRRI